MKENKNSTTLQFLAALVKRSIFDEIVFYCLPVGHTHNHVDQMFSTILKWLLKHDVLNLEDFANSCENKIYKTAPPSVHLLSQLWNFTAFLPAGN